MCMRCDGYSEEEIERHTDLVIRVHGFLMQQVEADPSWTYTIGALESWARPELIVVDIDAETQVQLLRAVADGYVTSGEILPSTLELLDVELVAVDEQHFRDGLVAAWEERYSMAATTGDFLQVVPGPSWFCEHHARQVRRLDDPDAAPAPRPNRAQRRARSKGKQGHR